MIAVSAGVIIQDGKVLLCQRKANAQQGLLWEFPGGKLEDGESPEAALERELFEELGIQTRTGRILDVVFYRYPARDVLVMFYQSAITAGSPIPIECKALEWINPNEIAAYSLAPADAIAAPRIFQTDI